MLLVLTIFVFAPLQAMGIFLFQGFAIVALLAIIGAMLVISDHPMAVAVMSVALVANIIVGIVGSMLGGWLAPKLGIAAGGAMTYVVAVGGAVLLIVILKVLGIFK